MRMKKLEKIQALAQAKVYDPITYDEFLSDLGNTPLNKIKLQYGETVAEVLDYVQYNAKKMVRTLETWVTTSVKSGIITAEEGKEFLSNYGSGLYGYTYLE